MKKQVRWKCERCGDGLLAPSKPRRDDVRRYCLPCSSETGKLVERFSPALEAQRITAKRKYQKKVAKRKQIERSLDAVVRDRKKARRALVAHVEKEAAKIWSMMLEIQSEIPARYRLPHHLPSTVCAEDRVRCLAHRDLWSRLGMGRRASDSTRLAASNPIRSVLASSRS
jgi:DNA-directed RNA polymerase subunit N (RpoN/RPB10)